MIEITDAQIEEFESRFEGLLFDNETKEFIKCLESKDIQACPGAGKTTSLVAKLDIIASQMPFKDNSGILVLTHTNVAVDEIKAKLGANAKILLSYPNHVGTFQSFVNKFLAIPMYVKLVGKRPERIDNEIYENIFIKQLAGSLLYGLKEKFKQQETTEQGKLENVKNFLKSFYIDLQDDNKLKKYNGDSFEYKHNSPSDTYKKIQSIKLDLFKNGIVTFDDMYYLAKLFLHSFPNMNEVFQKRFKYVFVDEVQDTDDKQFEILDTLFSNSDVVIQRIGDKNQEIFAAMGSKARGWQVTHDKLEIKNTKRLSSKISEKVTHFAISPQELNGIEAIEIQPVILLFDRSTMSETVFLEFSRLIEEYGLNNGNKLFRAVGAVKEHESGYGISEYFPSFIPADNASIAHETLLEKFELFDTKSIFPKEYKKTLMSIIIEYLKAEEIKNDNKFFTVSDLLKYLRENHKEAYSNFKLKLFEGVQKLNSKECSFDVLKEKLQIVLNKFGHTLDEQKLKNIIKAHKLDIAYKTDKNQYRYSNGGIEFDIHISTIHKAKGETHTATLVLETYYYDYDLKKLLPLLKGESIANGIRNDHKRKLLYVAMSRPTHLLCLAINKEHVSDEDKSDLESCGYLIKDITTP
ncbi:MAG: UvrD-helicase domain-containing protein [Aliarcobacter sp.]|nr:UvrD-helicase domain-containing protein [Aliarcobacter sp.]